MTVRSTGSKSEELQPNVTSSADSGPRVEFVLGTAQLGMKYGRVNDCGKPARSEAIRIVQHAIGHGVVAFDTARGYGDSETVLGQAIEGNFRADRRIITKLDLSRITDIAGPSEVRRKVDESIGYSCRALRATTLHTVLLHKWEHFRMWGGTAWGRLLELREKGAIRTLGTSVYEPDEALDAIRCQDIQHLQIPANVLDRRWTTVIAKKNLTRTDIVLHVRSVLLQGILAHAAERWPTVNGFSNQECIHKLQECVTKFDRWNVTDLCFAYIRSLQGPNGVVVGCETLEQLDENLELFRRPTLTDQQTAELEEEFPITPVELLNPAKWERAIESRVTYAT